MYFPKILMNPIIWKIEIFVTSHFTTLCKVPLVELWFCFQRQQSSLSKVGVMISKWSLNLIRANKLLFRANRLFSGRNGFGRVDSSSGESNCSSGELAPGEWNFGRSDLISIKHHSVSEVKKLRNYREIKKEIISPHFWTLRYHKPEIFVETFCPNLRSMEPRAMLVHMSGAGK